MKERVLMDIEGKHSKRRELQVQKKALGPEITEVPEEEWGDQCIWRRMNEAV